MTNPDIPRILLVDDIRLFRELEKVYLRRHACELLTADSGESALEIASSEPLDLIVLDDQMPGLGGLEACRRLKAGAGTSAIPVLMTSNPGLEAGCLQAGADEFVGKPILQSEFISKVRRLLPHLQERVNERAFVSVPVEVDVGGRTIRGESRDLSVSGMFIKSPAGVSLGERVKLKFALPGVDEPILAAGEVRNRVVPAPERRMSPGFGVRFEPLGREAEMAIRDFVRRIEGVMPAAAPGLDEAGAKGSAPGGENVS